MKTEIQAAANFLTNLLRLKCDITRRLDLQEFCSRLESLLRQHYCAHWFPDKPCKGSGYRCIRINHKMDPILLKTGLACGLAENQLRELFPSELTLWIDPREVSYRIGEDGSVCVLYDASADALRDVTDEDPLCTPPRHRARHDTDHSMSSEDDSCSPMSMSPPSPGFDRRCKNTGWDNLIMDPRNIFEISTFVAS